MELSSSKIRKFLIYREVKFSGSNNKFPIFFQKKAFLIFWEMGFSYISGNGNPPKIPNISGIEEAFLYFRKQKPKKNSLYFRKQNFLIFQEVTFRAWKKTILRKLVFQEMKLSSPKLKKPFMFQERICNAWKTKKKILLWGNFLYFSQKVLTFHDGCWLSSKIKIFLVMQVFF